MAAISVATGELAESRHPMDLSDSGAVPGFGDRIVVVQDVSKPPGIQSSLCPSVEVAFQKTPLPYLELSDTYVDRVKAPFAGIALEFIHDQGRECIDISSAVNLDHYAGTAPKVQCFTFVDKVSNGFAANPRGADSDQQNNTKEGAQAK